MSVGSTELAAVGMSDWRHRATSRWGVAFALTAAAGVVLRVWIYRSTMGLPDSDEAIVGLMTRHIIHGQITTFYWGQAYGGPQEALLAVPGFVLFGSSWLALRIVPIVLSGVGALLVWRVGRRTIGEPAAAVAGALFWIWPPFVLFKLTHQYDFYGSDVVYCGLLLLLALRVVERPDRLRVGLFGLVAGLALWQTLQIVPIAVGVIVWTVRRQPKCLRHAWLAAVLAVLGALPWLVWNLRHDWGSLRSPIDDTTSYQHRLRLFLSPVMPMILGTRGAYSQQLLLPSLLTYAIYLALVILFFRAAFRSRGKDISLLYVVVLVFPFVYAISPQTLWEGDPRYVVVLAPVLALLFAQVAMTYWRAVGLLAVAGILSYATLHKLDDWLRTQPQDHPSAPRNLAPLISTLDRLHLDRVYANVWIAYVLDFDTDERIVAVQNKFTQLSFANGQATPADDPHLRYPPYQDEVRAARHGFVFFRDGLDTIPIVPQLERDGYKQYPVGPLVVFAPG